MKHRGARPGLPARNSRAQGPGRASLARMHKRGRGTGTPAGPELNPFSWARRGFPPRAYESDSMTVTPISMAPSIS